MVEPGRHLGFLDEHPHESRIVGEAGQDPLHDEYSLESRGAPGAPLEDVGHTAAPNPLEERVLAELNRLFELLGHVRSRVRGRSRPIPPACESSAPGTSSVVSEDSSTNRPANPPPCGFMIASSGYCRNGSRSLVPLRRRVGGVAQRRTCRPVLK